MRRPLATAVLVAATSALTACAPTAGPTPEEDPVGFDLGLPRGAEVTTAPTPATAPTTAAPPDVAPTDAGTPPPTPAPVDPTVTRGWPVALVWDGIELRLPSDRTELVGFHESNHDGARDVQVVEGSVAWVVLETRERGTGPRSASDIVVHPDTELRAPVTGTVKRAGTYTLYCDNLDDFLVIEPDGRPGIEVKLLHIDGVQVGPGDRVEAGVTVVAPRPTPLPFASQVDEHSAAAWPHVHLEVVDTAIPDIPNSNSGSDDC